MKKLKKLTIIILAITLLIAGYFAFLQKPEIAAADWWDDSWLYRQTVEITNSGTDQTDFQVMITLDSATLITANKMQSDCDDIRITDISGKLIPHWIEPTTCNTATTKIWTKVPSISTSGDTVYLYYGNSAVNSTSSLDNIFIREISEVQGAWDMDEASWTNNCSTSTVFDASGNSNNGKSCPDGTGPLGGATGKFGNGGLFDGSNDYVDVGDNNLIQGGSGTLEAWIYFTRTSLGDYTTILSNGDDITSSNVMWLIKGWAYPLMLWTPGNVQYVSSTNVPTNTWSHWIVTFDGDNVIFYYNGQQNSITPQTSSIVFNGPALIGAKGWSPPTWKFNGSIDSVRIYNTALTQSEISDLYGTGGDRHGYVTTNYPNKSLVRKYSATVSVGSPASEERGPGPVAYWKFDEGFGQTANDSTINANNGTLGGGTEAYKPTWQTEDMCVSGKCLKFDGVDDYVDGGNGDSLNITNAITIEAWVKYNEKLTEEMIVGKDSAYILHKTNDGFEHFAIYDGTYKSVSNQNILTDNEIGVWRHRVGVYDGQQYLKLYINGTLVGTSDIGNVDIDTSAYPLRVGFISGWASAWHFNGFIDSVKIYPYARTAAQIKADYSSRGTGSGVSVAIGDEGKKSLSDGLVGYWKMDEASWNGTADEVIDSSGSGNDGVRAGDATTAAGKFGNGGTFDGTGDYVDAGSNSSLNITDAITIGVWVKANSWAASNKNKIVDKTGNENTGYILYQSYGTVYFMLRQGYSTVAAASFVTSQIPANEWHYLTGVWDGTNINIYLDGVLKNTDTGTSPTTTTGNLRFGRDNGVAQHFFNGSIDSVRIYNRALSPGEVRDLYNFAPGPVGWWKMDEKVSGNGQTINDSSGYGNTGTTSSANGTGMDCMVPGKYGSGCEFDGVDDYVLVTDSPLWDLASDESITIEAWIKFTADTSGTYGNIWGDYSGPVLQTYKVSSANYKLLWSDSAIRTGDTLTYTFGRWYHIVVIRTGSTNVTFYRDGVSAGSAVPAGGNKTPNFIGVGGNGSGEYFNGSIDDVRIYNYARTQAQIMEDYSAGAGRKQPIGHWKFDEGYGTTANNSGIGGSALNGTLTNMASPATSASGWTDEGKMGKGLVFDGGNDYVEIGSSAKIDNSSQSGTISAWVKFSSISTLGTIFNYGGGGTQILNFRIKDVSGIYYPQIFVYQGTSTNEIRGSSSLVVDTWYHIVFSSDSSVYKIYINGREEALTILQGLNTGDWFIDVSPTETDATSIGRRLYNGSWEYPFNGSIDDVKIYNYALTEDEVRQEYNQGALLKLGSTGTDSSGNADDSQSREYCIPGDTSTCNPPVGRWDFNEGTGSTVNDISGNANTGTWNGTGSHWTQGKIGKGGSFNGSDDYVSIPNFTLTFPATVIMWVKPSFGTLSQSRTFLSRDGGTSFLWFYQAGINKINLYDGSDNIGTVDLVKEVEWQQIAITFDESGNGYQWYNGQQDLSFSTISEPTNPFELRIGDWSSYNWNGSIDQVRIYDYARTSAQVAWDYNRGKPIAHWKFDECQGGTAYDSSGNANNGTITIGATVPQTVLGTCETPTDNSGAWYNGVGGKVNSSMSFDGSDDYVSVPATELTEYSIGFWAYRNTNTLYEFVIGHDTLATKIGFLSGDDKLFVRSVHGGSSDTSVSVSTGIWNYIVVTRNSNNKIDAYVNGGTANRLFSDAAQSGTFYFNTIGEDEGNNNFNGLIDEVKIYNYALTAEQIKMEYNGGAVRFE